MKLRVQFILITKKKKKANNFKQLCPYGKTLYELQMICFLSNECLKVEIISRSSVPNLSTSGSVLWFKGLSQKLKIGLLFNHL